MKKRIFISAGDISGDIYGANLIKAVKQRISDIEFIGIGGPRMISEGLNPIVDFEKISVMGFWEVFKRIFFFKRLLKKCKKIAKTDIIDCFIGIDYPGFNLRLEAYLTKQNIKVYHYIAPQVWAWGKNRYKKLIKSNSKIFNILPFETEYFSSKGINSIFVGHPLMENEIIRNIPLPIDKREFKCAILAGSRKQELIKHIPILKEVVKDLAIKYPKLKFATCVTNVHHIELLKKLENDSISIEFYEDSKVLMSECSFGIIKSGTSTLEAALCGLPFITIYRTSPLTYYLAKRLINIDYISLPNILLKNNVITELIQNDFNAKNTVKIISNFIDNPRLLIDLQIEILKTREILNFNKSTSENIAKIIYSENFAN